MCKVGASGIILCNHVRLSLAARLHLSLPALPPACLPNATQQNLHKAIRVVVKIMVPFLGTLNIRFRIIIGIQKGTIILTTSHKLPDMHKH